MADDTSINSFSGDLNKELAGSYVPKNDITHARNLVNYSSTGDVGTKGNEPANRLIGLAPFTIIGRIYLYDDVWVIFSTDNFNCELGTFKESTETYTEIIRDTNFNWNKNNLITGKSRMNFDCSWSVYFSDGHRNPDRVINLDNLPLQGEYVFGSDGCKTFQPYTPLSIAAEKMRLNPPIMTPCINVRRGTSGGNLLNGTYYVTMSYTIDGQRIANYSGLSNAVSIFHHDNVAGSIEINFTDLDVNYDQYELVLISIVNRQVVARRMGLYSTNQTNVFIDDIPNDLPAIPLSLLTVTNPLMDSSDSITELADRLIRVAPKSKFDFNYQPLANQINMRWVIVEYPADYYRSGGTNTNFMRDENYTFFIRWVYDDTDRSPSFIIPGRAPLSGETDVVAGIYGNTYHFENVNTASSISNSVVDIGDVVGYQIMEGDMGYHDTDERYPDNQPAVWGDLCGKKIRLHKFPDRSQITNYTNIYSDTAISFLQGPVIRVLGVKALNIKAPVDNDGVQIPNIVGYELLVGSREGHKTIIAKGIINNTFAYDLSDDVDKAGLYPNYPYNSLASDPFISRTETETAPMTGALSNFTPNGGIESASPRVTRNIVTFHSPDTTFRKPFLSAQEIKLDGIVSGSPILKFIEPKDHPKHKLMTNMAFFVGTLVGIGLGVTKLNGARNSSVLSNIIPGGSALTSVAAIALGVASIFSLLGNNIDKDDSINNIKDDSGDIVEARDPGSVETLEQSERKNMSTQNMGGLFGGGGKTSERTGGIGRSIGNFLRGALMGGMALFVQFWAEGVDTALQAIQNMSQWQQYALQQVSHCFYNLYYKMTPERYRIANAKYLGQSFQDFDNVYRVNNLYRTSTVILRTHEQMSVPVEINSSAIDNSKQSLTTISLGFTGQAANIHQKPTKVLARTTASSFYASIKERRRNQYGQIGTVKQIPMGCINKVSLTGSSSNDIFTSPVIFGGDTYITRYTEKNTMFFFTEWLYKQFDGHENDYLKDRMVQFPAYWADTQKFDTADFVKGVSQNLGGSISSVINSSSNTQLNAQLKNDPYLPTGYRALDRKSNDGFVSNPFIRQSYFVVKNSYFYLFVSGVRDFYVESDINLGYRDWEDPPQKRFYDHETYTNLNEMFEADPVVVKADNFCKYDYSLSVSKSFVNQISWGSVQPSNYDPDVAEDCFVSHPKRLIYSLPQLPSQIVDSWRIFLTNNYKDFKSDITTVKEINQTGAIMIFKSDSPLIIQGDETLKLSSTTITIGDGSFLARMPQNITNAEKAYQLGASREPLAVVNTPSGLFWMSPEQGKIFTMSSNGMIDIAVPEMVGWLSKNLPYNLLIDHPDFPLVGNPITGIGCQVAYDSESGVIYFSKRDFIYRRTSMMPGESNRPPVYNTETNLFEVQFDDHSSVFTFALGDPEAFTDASWTFSYDTRTRKWISWHDWRPDLTMPSKLTFLTIKEGGIWKHNDRCDKFCNFYGVDYPFELEYKYHTGINVTTLQSIEYYLEVYKYNGNCVDRYLYLDENFDEAVIFNNEQCSGLLKLVQRSADNPFQNLQYPIDNGISMDVLYSRIENKYRLNMFADITDDRGQDSNARRMIWNTDESGYKKVLNIVNLDYGKNVLQRKAFRGYICTVFLRKRVSNDKKFLMLFAKNKTLESKR